MNWGEKETNDPWISFPTSIKGHTADTSPPPKLQTTASLTLRRFTAR